MQKMQARPILTDAKPALRHDPTPTEHNENPALLSYAVPIEISARLFGIFCRDCVKISRGMTVRL